MIISKNWLRSIIPLPDDIDLDLTLTNVGLEVESIERTGGAYSNVISAEVLTCEKHPDAKKLSVCRVHDGVEVVTVVCGAPNVAAGQKVAFARVGAHLPKIGITVDRRTLRGVESAGMICSESELGVSSDHSGIMVLPPDTTCGIDMHDLLGAGDEIVQIGITPNRGDALSHLGVARDLAAVLGLPLTLPDTDDFPADLPPVSVTIDVPDLCPRYSAAVMEGITIGPSPDWLKRALESVGVRSINNVVDVTNHVMMELGQPMHAFDLDLLAGGRIHVRQALEGEKVTTLDGQERLLPTGALMICDAEKPVAVAGVMGAGNSEIRDTTTTLLLESAFFNPSSVRRTSKLLGLMSESSYRFERGTDPDGTVQALQRAVSLLTAIAGGCLTAFTDAHVRPYTRPSIVLRTGRVEHVLGIAIPLERQRAILDGLQFETALVDDGILCRPPSCRSDIEREIDVIEEIARIHGYDNIPLERSGHPTDFFEDEELHVSAIRHHCLALGCDEIISSSLVPREHAALYAADEQHMVTVLNPVSKERPAMRSSLVPGLLETIDRNLRNGRETIRIFEIGSSYHRRPEKEEGRYFETLELGFAMSGMAQEREWYAPARRFDFYDLKGVVSALLGRTGILDHVTWELDDRSEADRLHLLFDGREFGYLEQVPKAILSRFDIDEPVFVAILQLEVFRAAMNQAATYQAVGKYPLVKRDIAMILDVTIPSDRLIHTITDAAVNHLQDVKVVDVYVGEQVGQGRKSVAMTLTFQSTERTLTEAEISHAVGQAVEALEKAHQAVLRS